MLHTTDPLTANDGRLETRRDRMLLYGFAASLLGVPAGLYLGLPAVWSLALAGILIGSIKLARRHAAD